MTPRSWWVSLGMPEFNRPETMRLSEAYRRKQKHIDIYNTCDSFEKYLDFPPTFDGSLPSEQSGHRRVQIGQTYLFEGMDSAEGTVGTVTAATVDEKKKLAHIAITRVQGGSVILINCMGMPTLATQTTRRNAIFLARMNFLNG
jgi:hypothetical protein